MIIRSANIQDAQDISEIGRESFTETFGHLFEEILLEKYLVETYSVEKISSSLSRKENQFFVAELDGDSVGFLKLKINCHHELLDSPRQIQLQKIYVKPGLTGSGVGSQLMQQNEAVAKSHAPVEVWLMVYEGNSGALRFYKRDGFSEFARVYHDFEENRVFFQLMRKQFSSGKGS